jgi:leucyl aminopeptidase
MLQLSPKNSPSIKVKTGCLVIAVNEGKFSSPQLKELDTLLEGSITRAVREGEFRGTSGQSLLLHAGKRLPAQRLLLVGMGKTKQKDSVRARQTAGNALEQIKATHTGSFAIDLASFCSKKFDPPTVQAVVEGLLLGAYQFDRYLSEREDQGPAVLKGFLLVQGSKDFDLAERAMERAGHIVEGVTLARDLVNEPGNVKSPAYLAGQARELSEQLGIKCEILEQEQLAALGCGALLGVAQGSSRAPKLITLEYHGGNQDARPIVLVGKGVVFDAGGISLKPAEKMDEMKMDMAGGAVVLGVLKAAALLKLPINLVGIVPAVENLPSGTAYRPGDILTSLSGKTIEVLNTDAEGRLILADALTYAARYQPRVVIDLATLTGACIIALGHHAAAVLGNHDGLIRQLIQAGERCGEKLWQLPLWQEYAAQLKSHVADMKNIGGRPAGTITAAAFLQKFADDYTWAHLDIAGTAWEEKGQPCTPKGGTGFGVRLLLEYLQAN